MADARDSRFPAGQLAIALAMLALSVTLLLAGRHGPALMTALAGAAGWVVSRLTHRSPAEQERAIDEAARRGIEDVRAAHERGGKEAVREISGIVVRRDADGSITVSQRPPSLKVRLGLPAGAVLVAAAFLAWKWSDLREDWLLVAIVGSFLLACAMILAAYAWCRQYYRASVEGLTVVTKLPLLPAFRRSLCWRDALELRGKDERGESLFPDVMAAPPGHKPLLLDGVLLETACEQWASDESRAVMERARAVMAATLKEEAGWVK